MAKKKTSTSSPSSIDSTAQSSSVIELYDINVCLVVHSSMFLCACAAVCVSSFLLGVIFAYGVSGAIEGARELSFFFERACGNISRDSRRGVY